MWHRLALCAMLVGPLTDALPVITGFDLLTAFVQAPALQQFTPDIADWSTFQSKALASNTGHDPDGISWIKRDDWETWDGTAYNPSKMPHKEFVKAICPSVDRIRGIRDVFYKHKPFADNKNPTKAEVDEWHRIAINHARALIGYTSEERQVKKDVCMFARALWGDERKYTSKWDSKYPGKLGSAAGPCLGMTNKNGHCGASFIPDAEDQKSYLPKDHPPCTAAAGSEGVFSGPKSNIPWSIKWSRGLCNTLHAEGFWGGHVGPFFHREKFGFSFWDNDPANPNNEAALRAKWTGRLLDNLYVDPDITNGRWRVNGAEPRFPGFECEGIRWLVGVKTATATECYASIMADPDCGKRFVTYNGGCGCYAASMTTCTAKKVSGRLTWDMSPVPASVNGGYFLPGEKLHSGEECQNIQWKTAAGDAFACLEKIMADKDCGTAYLTWNSANGGCACYPPDQKTCTPKRRSGRQTYEIKFDATRGATAPPVSTVAPSQPQKTSTPLTTAPTATPTIVPTEDGGTQEPSTVHPTLDAVPRQPQTAMTPATAPTGLPTIGPTEESTHSPTVVGGTHEPSTLHPTLEPQTLGGSAPTQKTKNDAKLENTAPSTAKSTSGGTIAAIVVVLVAAGVGMGVMIWQQRRSRARAEERLFNNQSAKAQIAQGSVLT